MAARIPPKKSEGWRRYWADRYLYERLEDEAKALYDHIYSTVLPPTDAQKAVLSDALKNKQIAALIVKKMWEETDYFSFNERSNT